MAADKSEKSQVDSRVRRGYVIRNACGSRLWAEKFMGPSLLSGQLCLSASPQSFLQRALLPRRVDPEALFAPND